VLLAEQTKKTEFPTLAITDWEASGSWISIPQSVQKSARLDRR